MGTDLSQRLERCEDFVDIFELVKRGVEKTLDKSRAGLMLGLANLGGGPGFFLGAYYTVDSNMIVMNAFPIQMLREKDARLVKPYVFHVLLHEYLHALGWHDEAMVRKLTFQLCSQLLGEQHFSSQMARDIQKFLPLFSYGKVGWYPKTEPEIFIVQGFDKGHLTYVS